MTRHTDPKVPEATPVLPTGLNDRYNLRARRDSPSEQFCRKCGHPVTVIYRPDLSELMLPRCRGVCDGCGHVVKVTG